MTAKAGGAFPWRLRVSALTSLRPGVLAPTCWATSNVTGTVSKGAGTQHLFPIVAVIATSGRHRFASEGRQQAPVDRDDQRDKLRHVWRQGIVGKVLFSADQASQIMHIINL